MGQYAGDAQGGESHPHADGDEEGHQHAHQQDSVGEGEDQNQDRPRTGNEPGGNRKQALLAQAA